MLCARPYFISSFNAHAHHSLSQLVRNVLKRSKGKIPLIRSINAFCAGRYLLDDQKTLLMKDH